MNLPSWINGETLGMIAYMTFALVQYLKAGIPEKFIPVASLAVAIGLAALFQFAELNIYVRFVLYGIFATATADLAYQFVSTTKSPAFTLPSKAQLNGKPKEEIKL